MFEHVFQTSSPPRQLGKKKGAFFSNLFTSQTAAPSSAPIKTGRLPSFLGGGEWKTSGPGSLIETNRSYAGLPSQSGNERDHIIPVSLGGTSSADNLHYLPNDDRGRQAGKVDVETQAYNDWKAGKISLPEARLRVATYNQRLQDGLDTSVKGNLPTAIKETVVGGLKKGFSAINNFSKNIDDRTKKEIPQPAQVSRAQQEQQFRRGITDQANLVKSKVVSQYQNTVERTKERDQAIKDFGVLSRKKNLTSDEQARLKKAREEINSLALLGLTFGGNDLSKVEKSFSDQLNGMKPVKPEPLVASEIKPAETKNIFGKLSESLTPLKHQDTEVRSIFKEWNRTILKGKETANAELAALPKEKNGLETILKYEKGQPTQSGDRIKKVFDSLFKEAKAKGLDVKYRENYLPQAYADKPEKVRFAVAEFLHDSAVDELIIKRYLDGIQELPKELSTRLKINPSFSKERVFPDYETAMKYGLTPRYTEPAQLAAYYKSELEKTVANKNLVEELLKKGKITTVESAGKNWKPLELPFSPKGYYAETKLAKMLNGLFRDENNLGFTDTLKKAIANASKTMQEIVLSAGVPKSDVNFFTIGQTIKNITAGDFKAVSAFGRANLNQASANYFKENADTLGKMANQGIDLGGRVGNYSTVYQSMKDIPGLSKKLGYLWHKAFNEKTFGSFMPQLYTQTFKEAEAKAIAKGMTSAEAERFAGDVTKNFYGLMENVGRAKGTEDALSAAFFAPKFREGIIRTLANTLKSVTSEIRNPSFYLNRRLFAGMTLTYAGYNALNKKLSGHYMWENPNGKEFDLEIPMKNGDVTYIGFMPSFLAFARNMASGVINTAKGDFDTAKQKFGSTLSMPLKLATELWANKDYFDRPIYNETDTPALKLKKMAEYAGLSVNHPFLREIYRQLTTDKPLYQSVSEAMELPLKFSSMDKIAQQEFYDALDQQKEKKAQDLERFKPTYEKVQNLVDQGSVSEAQAIVDGLSDPEYEMYKSLKTADKRKQSNSNKIKMFDTYKKIQELIRQGNTNEAQRIVDGMTDDEYAAYQSLKKAEK